MNEFSIGQLNADLNAQNKDTFYHPMACHVDFDFDHYDEHIEALSYYDLQLEWIMAIDELGKIPRHTTDYMRTVAGRNRAYAHAKKKLDRIMSLQKELSK